MKPLFLFRIPRFAPPLAAMGFLFVTSLLQANTLIVAHAAGKGVWFENSMFAIAQSIEADVDVVEVDVQVTKDDVVVLYRPADISELTNGSGRVADLTYAQIKQFTLGNTGEPIAALTDVLATFEDTNFIIDMKSLPAQKLVDALNQNIDPYDLDRLLFYSTNAQHIQLLKETLPDAKTFETREATRARILVHLASDQKCILPNEESWFGFEIERTMKVTEQLRLGPSSTLLTVQTWNEDVMDCFADMSTEPANIAFFGINSQAAFEDAIDLGADAVYVDNPLLVSDWINW